MGRLVNTINLLLNGTHNLNVKMNLAKRCDWKETYHTVASALNSCSSVDAIHHVEIFDYPLHFPHTSFPIIHLPRHCEETM